MVIQPQRRKPVKHLLPQVANQPLGDVVHVKRLEKLEDTLNQKQHRDGDGKDGQQALRLDAVEPADQPRQPAGQPLRGRHRVVADNPVDERDQRAGLDPVEQGRTGHAQHGHAENPDMRPEELEES